MKPTLLNALVFTSLLTFSVHGADKVDELHKPNVVLVLVDDLGWMDLSCQGSACYETPHIDRLATDGIRFTNGYAACAVCSPTRAAIQTGRYPHRTGVTDFLRFDTMPADEMNPCWLPKEKWITHAGLTMPHNALWLDSKEVTLAELLKPVGFKSCYVGKWHLGMEKWYPEKQGYDFNFGGCKFGQPPSYFDPYKRKIPSLPSREAGEYLTDREADEAVGFIRKHKDEPFFLMLANYAVHKPIQAKADITKKYSARTGKKRPANPKYAAMIESVDDAVGKVVTTLKELGLTDKTMIIFTSDNGGLSGTTSNAPLKSGKGYPFEGGIRVPLIVKWPGVARAGVVVDQPVISMDIFATVAAATGANIGGTEIDGVDLKPLLTGKDAFKTRPLFWHFPHIRHKQVPYSIIRDGKWKLIKWYTGRTALFNLEKDISENNDLTKSMPEKVIELDKKLTAHLTSVTDRIPFKSME